MSTAEAEQNQSYWLLPGSCLCLLLCCFNKIKKKYFGIYTKVPVWIIQPSSVQDCFATLPNRNRKMSPRAHEYDILSQWMQFTIIICMQFPERIYNIIKSGVWHPAKFSNRDNTPPSVTLDAWKICFSAWYGFGNYWFIYRTEWKNFCQKPMWCSIWPRDYHRCVLWLDCVPQKFIN